MHNTSLNYMSVGNSYFIKNNNNTYKYSVGSGKSL